MRVRNFRSVLDSGWIQVEKNNTVLIGKNESGKTSILEAISFFSNNSELNDRKLCNLRTYEENEDTPIVNIEITIDDNDPGDFHQISKDTGDNDRVVFVKYQDGRKRVNGNFNPDDTTWKRAKYMYRAREMLENLQKGMNSAESYEHVISDIPDYEDYGLNDIQSLRRDTNKLLNQTRNTVKTETDTEREAKKRYIEDIEEMRSLLSKALNQTTDVIRSLPDIIYYPEINALKDSYDREDIDEEDPIAKILSSQGVNFRSMSGDTTVELDDQLLNIGQYASNLISNSWKQKSVDIRIRHMPDDNFRVVLRDVSLDSSAQDRRTVDRPFIRPSERSVGFRWFLSFCMSVIMDSKRQQKRKLILLDDPAVYLHPEGKIDCRSALTQTDKSTQIMYSTHSPYMIDKKRPEQIRVVEDYGNNRGTVVTESFQDVEGIALEPVRKALGISLGDLLFVSGKCVLL